MFKFPELPKLPKIKFKIGKTTFTEEELKALDKYWSEVDTYFEDVGFEIDKEIEQFEKKYFKD